MSSTVKSGWRLVAGTFAFCVVLLILPSIFFSKEISILDKLYWIFVPVRLIIVALLAFLAYRVIVNREDPAAGPQRAIMIGVAAVYFIFTMAFAASYRSDASDNIAPTAQAKNIDE